MSLKTDNVGADNICLALQINYKPQMFDTMKNIFGLGVEDPVTGFLIQTDNFVACRIPLKRKLNIEPFRFMPSDYEDKTAIDFLESEFPIGLSGRVGRRVDKIKISLMGYGLSSGSQ